jgi:SOS-response transcriptional repressor LexA
VGYLAGSEDYWLKMEEDSMIPRVLGSP